MQGNYRTSRIPRYCCLNHHRFASMFHSWNQAFRNTGFLGRSPNINPAWCEQCEGWLILQYYVFPIIRRPGFIFITPCFSPFNVAFSNRSFSNRSSTADDGFVKLSSDCFCGNGLQNEYWVLLPPLLRQFYDFQTQSSSMNGDSFHLVLVFSHYSS